MNNLQKQFPYTARKIRREKIAHLVEADDKATTRRVFVVPLIGFSVAVLLVALFYYFPIFTLCVFGAIALIWCIVAYCVGYSEKKHNEL